MLLCIQGQNNSPAGRNNNRRLKTIKKTIAQLRFEEAVKLAGFKSTEPTAEEIKEAVTLMNSFYRFCGLDERVFYLENDERRHNSRYTAEQTARRDRWLDKLVNRFSEYGLTLTYCGYLPSIGTKNEHGGFSEKIYRYFYK